MTVSKDDNAGLRDQLTQAASENRLLNTAFESLPQAVCIYDAAGTLVFANRQYAELYRLSHDKLVPGMRWDEVITLRIENGIYAGGSPDEPDTQDRVLVLQMAHQGLSRFVFQQSGRLEQPGE